MHTLTAEEIQTVYQKILPYIRKTPTIDSIYHSKKYKAKIALKLENLNITGSFKIRGASNAILSADPELVKNGIVAASAGNHAQGVAYACKKQGIKATVFMPLGTPFVKTNRTRSMGADIVIEGETYDDAYAAALELRDKNNMFMVHPFADLNVIKGQGTIGIELLEQVPDIGAVIVPIGGGGMISGIGAYIKSVNPSVKIIGVQSISYPAMKESFYANKIIKTERLPTIADGIAVKNVNELNFALVQKYVDKIVCVSEDEIAEAIMELMEQNRVVAEGAAATSIAALKYLPDELAEMRKSGKTIVSIVCGGNIDVNLLSKIVNRGLIHSGRLMQLKVNVKDRPGGLAALLAEIAKSDANILQVHHQRVFGTKHYKDVEVDLELEVTNFDHQSKIQKALKDCGYTLELR